MVGEVVGREQELGLVYAFLDRPVEGSRGFVFEGEAGIGKSTLWLAAVAAARERAFLILSSRPAEAERGLAHVVLGDLFDAVLADVLPTLTAPRRRALEAALLTDEAPGHPVDPRALGVAIHTSLEVLARERPLVLAVDDEQWVDASSASALRFALRRVRDERLILLLARRLDEHADAPTLERSIDSGGVEQLRVGPLSMGAINRLLQHRLGRTFARPTLLRLLEVSGGNPFYALELACGLGADGAIGDPTEPFPVPERLEVLLRGRLEAAPRATREALMLAAAQGQPSRRLLRAAGVAEDVLEPAVAAHLIERAGDAVRFTHPLLASVLYQGSPAATRRRAHRLLAQVVDDPIGRALHLARAAEGQDSAIAAALDDAAGIAARRGAPVVAAELAELAIRLTPADAAGDRARRLIAAAWAQLTCGDFRRARALAHEILASTPEGEARSEALVILADVEAGSNRSEQSVALLREALREASADPALLSSVHRKLAYSVRFTEGLRGAERHARSSLEFAERLDDHALRAKAQAALALIEFNAGDPDGPRLAEAAYELAVRGGNEDARLEAGFCLAHVLMWSAQHERGRALLESLHRDVHERDEEASASALWYLTLLELQAGRWAIAAEYIERARTVALQYTVDEREPGRMLTAAARIAVHRGELDLARELAQRGLAGAETAGDHGLVTWLEGVLAVADLWSGDAVAAIAHFVEAEQAVLAAETGEPNMLPWRADYVEGLLALGRVDDSVALLDAWERDALHVGREWVLAQVVRCRGLVAAAHGDLASALAMLEEAIRRHEEVEDPFGRARALLALGVVRRRARQKRAARNAIQAALEGFETVGAAGWAEEARLELGRIGGRTRVEGLTPAEQRVAALVAKGRTNREVAAALFLGERTVETHLSHIYAKLGVRSRAELARTFQR
jgi:DNA-binding CsgD family transcriptional regulator